MVLSPDSRKARNLAADPRVAIWAAAGGARRHDAG
jgi:hypothetical protein